MLHQELLRALEMGTRFYRHVAVMPIDMDSAEQVGCLQNVWEWLAPAQITPEDIMTVDQLIRDHKLEALTSPVDWVRRWAATDRETILSIIHNGGALRGPRGGLHDPLLMTQWQWSLYCLFRESDPELD